MKFCPTCQTRYDEEILRFCTKDGTPLVDEEQPNFVQMPSESLESVEEDYGEETVIRRKPSTNPLPSSPPVFDDESTFQTARNSSERIVIPTAAAPLPAASGANAAYQAPPQKSNTAKVVALTILGTLLVLVGAGAVVWMLQNDAPNAANTNANANFNSVDTNVNTNLGDLGNFDFNANSNTNANANLNANANANANVKTPTPTPKPSPSPTPSPTPGEDESETNSNTNPANTAPRPTATPSPRPTAEDAPPVNRPVNLGVLNSRAVNLPTPAYPSAARQLRAAGRVTVEVALDEDGNVTSARAVSGHPLLRQSAEAAARQSRFNPVRVSGQPSKATGLLVYNFVNN